MITATTVEWSVHMMTKPTWYVHSTELYTCNEIIKVWWLWMGISSVLYA